MCLSMIVKCATEPAHAQIVTAPAVVNAAQRTSWVDSLLAAKLVNVPSAVVRARPILAHPSREGLRINNEDLFIFN